MDENDDVITPAQARSTNEGTSSNVVIAKSTRISNAAGTSTEKTTDYRCRTTDESTEESETEEVGIFQRLLTACCRSGRLGAACYTLQTGELQILEEIVDRPPEHQIFVSLFNQVEPVQVILDGKGQGTFVSAVKRVVMANDTNESTKCKLVFISSKEYKSIGVGVLRCLNGGLPPESSAFSVRECSLACSWEPLEEPPRPVEIHAVDVLRLRLLSSKDFEACKRRIHSLSLPHEPANCSDEERIVFLRTVIDFSQTQTVHALGALLRYLDLNWSNLIMDLYGKPQYLALTRISLADIVAMDEDTYRGLQVFSSLSHPSGFKKGVQGSNKEGLSLYQLFSKCSSKVGHRRMRILLRHPTKDLETLRRRQDVVAYFMRPQSDAILRNICASVRLIKNVNGILAKIKALSAKPYQWKSLYNTLYNVVLISELCENAGQNEYLERLANYDTEKLYEMALFMNRIIDFDLSKSEGKFTVKAGVDHDLDLKKQTMASLHGLMSETARVELERLPPFIEECAMLYIPHLGYLLGVKAWADNLTMEQKELPNMKFMFQNNDYIHYKSKGCEELDMMIGDTYPEIVAHETRIMMRLTSTILENLHTLAAAIDICAELDCLITISKVCKEYSFVKPNLTRDKVISIQQGKHPLFITTMDNFVPNDVECSQEAGYVKILTGPNSSGKSVYMKQIGLIVYLAHIGSFVPAESATIGIVEHIYSRIQSTECIAAHMSAFLIDLRQMALSVRESSSNSLILVDEFGKGTSQTDGLALLAACLNTLLFRGAACPHVLLSTHFLNVHEYIVDTRVVRFMRFEHMIQDGEPVFLYRVVEGSSESSLALQVAESSGVEARQVARARKVLDAVTHTLPPPDKKITSKLQNVTEIIKNTLLTEDI